MSADFDTRINPSVDANPSYWDNPAADQNGLDSKSAPLAQGPDPVAPAAEQAADGTVKINGTAAGTPGRDRQTPDGKTIEVSQLHKGSQVDITREITPEGGYDQVVLTTGSGNDDVQVTQRDDGTLDVGVNGEKYEVRLGSGQELTIRSGDGNDTINVASNVKVNIVVDGGDGDDNIATGAGEDRIDGGLGNDTIATGAGRDDVYGNSGNDKLDAGTGDDVVYGGDGDDILAGGDGVDYVEGGKGKDDIDGGAGQDMLSGGLDDDKIRGGAGDDRIYTGNGKDTVDNDAGNDTVYAQKATDVINSATGARATVVNVEISSAKGVEVKGTDAFKQRVEADIEFLRSSPDGQQMLAQFDKAAAKGNTVTIVELANEQNGFAQTLGRGNAEITNGKAGEGSDVQISFNPSFSMAEFPAPVAVLYHEMSHAFNGVTGTFQPGTFTGVPGGNNTVDDRRDISAGVPNAERQAVGLETSGTPFDFLGDGNKTTHNPDQLTENGLRAELGLPDRPSYAF